MTTTSQRFLVPCTRAITPAQLHAGPGLQHRDEWVVRMLAEHRALSTPQLIALGFDTDPAAAQKRLTLLVRRGWLNRIGPGVTAHTYLPDTVWCPGPLGAALTALDDDPVSAARVYRDTVRLAADRRLGHLLATNDFFVNLATYARTHPPTTDLRTWWSPRTCGQLTVSPRHESRHGEYLHDGRRMRFWFEPDDGAMRPATLAARIHRYHRVAARTDVATVLMRTTEDDREDDLRRHLARLNLTGLYVATSHRYLGHPAGAVWLPMASRHRIALHHLPENTLAYRPDDEFLHDAGYHAPHPIYDPRRPYDESVADDGHTYTPPPGTPPTTTVTEPANRCAAGGHAQRLLHALTRRTPDSTTPPGPC